VIFRLREILLFVISNKIKIDFSKAKNHNLMTTLIHKEKYHFMTKNQTNNALIKFGIAILALLIVMVFQGCRLETEQELAINAFLQEMNPELAKKITNIEEEISITQDKIEKLSELKQKHPKYADKIEVSRQKWEQLQQQLKDTLKKISAVVESSYVAYELDKIQGGTQFNNISEKLLTTANSVLTSAHTTKEAIDEALYELDNSTVLFATEEESDNVAVEESVSPSDSNVAVEESVSPSDSIAVVVEESSETISYYPNQATVKTQEVEGAQTVDSSDTVLPPSTIKSNSSNHVLPTQLSKVLKGHSGDVNTVAFSPDGQQLASGSNDHSVKLWDINTGKEISTFTDAQDDILTVAFHPDGHLLAAGGNEQTIQLWDLNTKEKTGTLVGHQGIIHSIAFSPDGQTLVSGSWDKTVRLWEINLATELRLMKGEDSIYSVAFSPDGKQIAVGSYNDTITLWATNTGQRLHTLQGNGMRTVYAVAFSPNGHQIISGDLSNKVRVWDTDTGNSLFILKGFEGVFGNILSVAFSPDGHTIVASGGGDQTIKWWNASTGEELQTHQNDGSDVRAITFSPDGRMLASAHDDNTIKLWITP
jgi:WD40 repeat protein